MRREMREASYRAAVAAYRKDLPIRTTRNKLESYLRAKNVHFFQDREFRWLVDLVKVGEDDVPIYCDTAYVYVSFAFVEAVPHEPLKPDDLDTLRGIDLSRHMTGCM